MLNSRTSAKFIQRSLNFQNYSFTIPYFSVWWELNWDCELNVQFLKAVKIFVAFTEFDEDFGDINRILRNVC